MNLIDLFEIAYQNENTVQIIRLCQMYRLKNIRMNSDIKQKHLDFVGELLVESVKFALSNQPYIKDKLMFDRLLSEMKTTGVILVGSHLGYFFSVPNLFRDKLGDKTLITTTTSPAIYFFSQTLIPIKQPNKNLKTILNKHSYEYLKNSLLNKNSVYLIIDGSSDKGPITQFLNGECKNYTGTTRLAEETSKPVWIIYLIKVDGQPKLLLERPESFNLQDYRDSLSDLIRQYPEQFSLWEQFDGFY